MQDAYSGLGIVYVVSASGSQDIRIVLPNGRTIGDTATVYPHEIARVRSLSELSIQNLGSDNIEIMMDNMQQYGQGIRIPARTQMIAGVISSLGPAASGGSSGFYYDRNPVTIFRGGSSTNAPPGPGALWTYGPFNFDKRRGLFIEGGFASLLRMTAAAAVNLVIATINIYPNGGGGANRSIVQALHYNNTVGFWADDAYRQLGLILPGDPLIASSGDALIGNTFDFSTGGSIFYDIELYGVEFDLV